MCGELAMASQLQLSRMDPRQLSVLLRTFLTLSCVPDAGWLFAVESAVLDAMQVGGGGVPVFGFVFGWFRGNRLRA